MAHRALLSSGDTWQEPESKLSSGSSTSAYLLAHFMIKIHCDIITILLYLLSPLLNEINLRVLVGKTDELLAICLL